MAELCSHVVAAGMYATAVSVTECLDNKKKNTHTHNDARYALLEKRVSFLNPFARDRKNDLSNNASVV